MRPVRLRHLVPAALCVLGTLAAGVAHHTVVLGIAFRDLQPHLFLMPTLVGVAFGCLILRDLLLREAIDESARLLAEERQRVFELNDRLAGTVTSQGYLLEQRERALYETQKQEALLRLAGGVAHDFNNLLAVVGCSAHLLRAKLPEDHPCQRYVEEIDAASVRGEALTRQLLAVGRAQPARLELLDVSQVVEAFLSLLQRSAGKQVTIETALDATPARVLAARGQLEQILLNLVVNARDACASAGKVQIRTRGVAPEELAELPHLPFGTYGCLEVCDDGTGIPPDTLARVFEPFFSTKDAARGSGLGLAVVQGIAKQWGGDVTIQSVVGEGTTVTVYLPVASGSAEGSPATPPVAAGPLQGAGEGVLLLEDQEAVRRAFKSILEQHGYRVWATADPDEAAQLAALPSTDFRLLLTDLTLAKGSGVDAAARIRTARPGVAILFMSGAPRPEDVARAAELSGVDVLHKPFAVNDLLRWVRFALAGGAAGTSS